jgi:hypothetical protein
MKNTHRRSAVALGTMFRHRIAFGAVQGINTPANRRSSRSHDLDAIDEDSSSTATLHRNKITSSTVPTESSLRDVGLCVEVKAIGADGLLAMVRTVCRLICKYN